MSFLNRVENREWKEARQNVETKLFNEIKAVQPEFSDREALGQAKLGALATSILTRRAGVPVTQMERWAPSASGVDRLGSRDSFGQKTGNLDANAKLIAEVKKWESLVDGLTRKPRQPVLMLTQTPVVMHLVGADFREVWAHPHLFDGMFPGSEKSSPDHHEHLLMTSEVLKQVPAAITDPVAVVWDDLNNSHVFVLDFKDAAGERVMVPVAFEATGPKRAVVNLVKTGFGRSQLWLDLQRNNSSFEYVNREKIKRLEEKPGADSLRAPNAISTAEEKYSNADGTRVFNETVTLSRKS